MRFKPIGLALAAIVAVSFAASSFAQPRTPPREITQVKGDLYRARNGNWYTVFLVTPAGIILGDPINETFAPWLKSELDTRFPGRPVRYVVYSHSHFDHAAGGAVFADTATFVAHENMLRNMDGRYPQMPGDMIDRNDNGVIDRDEIDIPTNTRPGVCGMGPGFFDGIDRNSDGVATPQELQQHIVKPTIVYNDRMRIELGGKVVELVHPGLEPLERRDRHGVPRGARGVRDGVHRRRARRRQRALAAERLRAVRRQPARGVDQVVSRRRGRSTSTSCSRATARCPSTRR